MSQTFTSTVSPRSLSSMGGARSFGMRYPSPFFDIAQNYIPSSFYELLTFCRFYFLTSPVHHVAAAKLAEYPVTQIVFDTAEAGLQAKYKSVDKALRLREFQVSVGLDYFVYGNAFVSLATPFDRWLECTTCKRRHLARKTRSAYRWRNMTFELTCTRCGTRGVPRVHDIPVRSLKGIRLIRWNPENITIKHNDTTGKSKYYLRIPTSTANDIRIGDLDALESTPWEFIEAVKAEKQLLFHPDNLYHLKRPTIAMKDQGWGEPLLLSALRDGFQLQVLRKAQEAVMMEHIVPLRVIYPGQSLRIEGAESKMNLQVWRNRVDQEINLWKRDPNYIPVLPMNIGFDQIGGNGKVLTLFNEIRQQTEMALVGMGVPPEFVFGGLNWSASNTSLRGLENMFVGYNAQRLELMEDFVIGRIADFMGWPRVGVRFDRFKMADDLQRSMFLFQLNQAGKISDRRLLEDIGEDFDKEEQRKQDELAVQLQTQRITQVATARVQGEAQLSSSRYATKAQELAMKSQMKVQAEAAQVGMAAPGAEDLSSTPSAQGPQQEQPNSPTSAAESPLQAGQGPGMDLRATARQYAAYLRRVKETVGPEAMYKELQSMQLESPQLYRIVVPLINDSGSKRDPTDALKNPVPTGSTPETDPSRAIG